MTEIEQLRADLATLKETSKIYLGAYGYFPAHHDLLIKLTKEKIADLESQQAPPDLDWDEVQRAVRLHLQSGGHNVKAVAQYVRHLEAKVAELDYELRCERIDGGKVRDDQKARIAEPVINDMRALKTAQQILATYKHLHDESTQKKINQAIGTLRQMAGTEAVAYKFDPTPDICPINQDDLREKLAELTTIANVIPPACGIFFYSELFRETLELARELVERRIEGVKKEMQG